MRSFMLLFATNGSSAALPCRLLQSSSCNPISACGIRSFHPSMFRWTVPPASAQSMVSISKIPMISSSNGCYSDRGLSKTFCVPSRCYSPQAERKPSGQKSSGALAHSDEKPFSELTVGQKVKRAGKDATYTGIVIAGIAVTGVMFFAIGRELFSGNSPSGVYSRAFKLVKNCDDVYVALGQPLKAYGEMNRRGRRRFTSHAEFERDGVKHMRMKFYIEGPSGKADVHLEAKQNEGGKYDFRYIFVEADNQRQPIIVLDNR